MALLCSPSSWRSPNSCEMMKETNTGGGESNDQAVTEKNISFIVWQVLTLWCNYDFIFFCGKSNKDLSFNSFWCAIIPWDSLWLLKYSFFRQHAEWALQTEKFCESTKKRFSRKNGRRSSLSAVKLHEERLNFQFTCFHHQSCTRRLKPVNFKNTRPAKLIYETQTNCTRERLYM